MTPTARIGQIIGMMIGSVLSPSWLILRYALNNYFSFDSLHHGPGAILSETLHMHTMLVSHPEALNQLVLLMVLSLVVSSLFIGLTSKAGSKAAVAIQHRLTMATQNQQPAPVA